MKPQLRILYKNTSREEYHSARTESFPYIRLQEGIEQYANALVPWHWHTDVELFYIEKGALEYSLPGRCFRFPAGTGGMIGTGVLHMTQEAKDARGTFQKIHIFDPSFLGGCARIQEKFIDPIEKDPWLKIISFDPEIPADREILGLLRNSFLIREEDTAYEILIRNALSEIWSKMVPEITRYRDETYTAEDCDTQLKAMMIFIYDHYDQKMTVKDIADAGFVSERECFRIFSEGLDITPAEFLKSHRIQMACEALMDTMEDITKIALDCGFSGGSYFTQAFKEKTGMTPSEYRNMYAGRTNKN